MRTPWMALAIATLVALPSVASAQFYPGPVFAPPPPPHVYFRQRVRWHHRHFVPNPVVIAPPPVWIAPVAPSPPPPPVYMAPPPVVITPQQPIYVQPQPYYVPPPVAMAPLPAPAATVVVQQKPRPGFANKLGLGATLEGLYSVERVNEGKTENQGFGVLGQLRYRSSRHLVLELMGGWERSEKSSFTRTDVPLSFGLMIPFVGPEYALAPYVVGAVGVNFATLSLIDSPGKKLSDERTQALANAGLGLELRLGPRFAINADVRVEGRWNLNDASEAVMNTTSINGKPVQPIQDSLGARAGLGAMIYF